MAMADRRPGMGVAVDVAVFTVQSGRLEVLLICMKRPPFVGRWALPGGRITPSETVEEAAVRELTEKTGLKSVFLEQLYTFSDPERDPQGRCISIAHLALIPPTAPLRTTEKYSGISWFPVDDLPALAFDHPVIVRAALARLRAKLEYTNIAYSLLPTLFTLGELQRLYETILGQPLDPRNFQRRIKAIGLVDETDQMRTGLAHRPARLYRFASRKPTAINVL